MPATQPRSKPTAYLTTTQSYILISGLLTGSAAAVFPACGNIFAEPSTFGFTSTQYGSLFIVQTLFAIVFSLLSPRLHRSISHTQLLKTGLAANSLAMLFLVVATTLPVVHTGRYIAVISASGFMGVGIGTCISVANVVSAAAWPARPGRGVAALHTMLGMGLALAPFGVSAGLAIGSWWLAPVVIFGLTLFLVWRTKLAVDSADSPRLDVTIANSERLPRAVIALGALAFLYGAAEATFSNWCVIYLHEVGNVGLSAAGLVLAGFWGAVMLGRLLYTAVSVRTGSIIALVSPVLMTFSFLLISLSTSGALQMSGYIVAGIGCAAVYPALLGHSSTLITSRRQLVSGVMVATVLAGTGTGTYLSAAIADLFALGLPQVYRLAAAIPLVIFVGGLLLGETRREEAAIASRETTGLPKV